MWLIVLIVIIVYYVYEKIVNVNLYWKKKGIPYVRPWPIFGNMGENVIQKKEVSQIIKEIYDAFPSERYVGIYQFRKPTLLIRDIKLVKAITVKEFPSFPEHYLFNNDDNDVINNKGLFSMGAKSGWSDMRKYLNQAFTLNKLKKTFPIIDESTVGLVNYIKNIDKEPTVDLKEVFKKFSCNVLAKTMLGIDCNCFEEPLPRLYSMGREINDFSGFKFVRFFSISISRTFTKLFKIELCSRKLFNLFFSMIKKSLHDQQHFCKSEIVNCVMSGSEDDGFKNKQLLTEDQIAMQLFGFFIGGCDAIPALLSYTFYELAANPNVQKRLYKEINSSIDDDSDVYNTLLNMKYLDMVVSEVLRKWPISVFVDRKCVKRFVIEPEKPHEKELVLEPGVVCWIPIYAIHRDPEHYTDPEKFDPERFAEPVQRSCYLPFGSGPRTCIASKFSTYVCKLVVTRMLQKYEVLSCKETVPPEEATKIAIFLSGGGSKVIFKPRNANVSTNT